MTTNAKPTTGLPHLDKILKGILPGDNIVWQVDSIKDYMAFVKPYAENAKNAGHKLIYFRFASHKQLLPNDFGAEIHKLNPEDGFESFISNIHDVIEKAGYGAYYVFDCLSELAGDWYSDQMLGNFFMLTCPYLYDLETIAYFALFRNHHSARAIEPISETTQLLLEVLRHKINLYVRPVKVLHRFSPTMQMFHCWNKDKFKPETSSAVLSEIRTSTEWSGLNPEVNLGFWDRAILDARESLGKEDLPPSDKKNLHRNHMDRLVKMMISRDGSMHKLVAHYFSLKKVLDIAKRMIGTGMIGGKAAGMLLAREILKEKNPKFIDLLETHDSFYLGSDVFYTFLVQNGIWWVRRKQRNPETFLQDSEQARRRILTGKFPDYIMKQLEDMLDYFGPAPFIVRSSSLLEDNFGNSFAGKYESVFCANQGPYKRRLEDFLSAIRTIYASTMSEKALRYRAQRNILHHDEQMALLIMRVSGSMHERKFFPAAAGVGFSFNPYAWNENIDPKAGVIRLVFGLGTRAVDRSDDDYTRIVALNAPQRRPESNFNEVRQYSQRRIDYLDLEANQLVSGEFMALADKCQDLPLEIFADLDMKQRDPDKIKQWVLTFDGLLTETNFVEEMKDMLSILQDAYKYPVDIEFTVNFWKDKTYKINLVQCRPLQVKGSEITELPKINVKKEDCIIKARGAVIGQSRILKIDRFIYVVPEFYGKLPLRDRHDVANLIAKINYASTDNQSTMILGPGRWGTSSPELGIPVKFHNINKASVLCEIVAMRDDLIPDVSLGTHFLNELVEMDMLYLALFPDQGDNYLNEDFFNQSPNKLLEIVPESYKWENMVKVIDPDKSISLHANAREQEVVVFPEKSLASRGT
ncbi:PEP/pyruvate-binding domain-containing protein [Verrucomicrobiota bacterium]